jgi:NAD(P)-dependent dehydrogenase (short-subunit alcohol dehydrogenase family)
VQPPRGEPRRWRPTLYNAGGYAYSREDPAIRVHSLWQLRPDNELATRRRSCGDLRLGQSCGRQMLQDSQPRSFGLRFRHPCRAWRGHNVFTGCDSSVTVLLMSTSQVSVAGQCVLVTAGAGGAGRVIAYTFADLGAKVYVCDIDERAVEATRRERSDIVAIVGDAADENVIDQVVSMAERQHGAVDTLINNVGIAGPTAPVEQITRSAWQETLEANITSHFLFVRRVVPAMKKRGSGLLVSVSSASAKVGLPLRLPYVVTKAALLSLTTNLARELGPSGIRSNAILPGVIRGDRINRVISSKAQALGVTPEAYGRRLLQFVSLRTMVEPDDIAAMAVFLASPAGARISGQLIGVDGNVEYEE